MSLPQSPITLAPNEGRFVMIGDSRVTFKVVGHDTDGQFGLFEYAQEPGDPGPLPHIHKKMVEMFYVQEGQVQLLVGDRTLLGDPGAFVLVPRGTAHKFSNPGPKPSKLLIMFCPADSREKYFEGLAELVRSGIQPGSKPFVELMRRYDQYLVDPLQQ